MKNIKSIAAGLFMALAVVGMAASPANAVLIEQDLVAASGDKFITVDSVTSLEWLDVNLTVGDSYNTAEASDFVTVDGFRHATLEEVLALFDNSGRVGTATLFSFENYDATVEFVTKFGCTGSCSLTSPFVKGIYETSPTTVERGLVQQEDAGPIGRYFPNIGSAIGLADANADTGNFLVRGTAQTVPEPGTLALFGLGLVGLGFARRKRAA